MFLKTLLVILTLGSESKVFGLQCYFSGGWKNQKPLDTELNKTNCDVEKKCFGTWFTGSKDENDQNLFSCADTQCSYDNYYSIAARAGTYYRASLLDKTNLQKTLYKIRNFILPSKKSFQQFDTQHGTIEFSGEGAGLKTHMKVKVDETLGEALSQELPQGHEIKINLNLTLKIDDVEFKAISTHNLSLADFNGSEDDLDVMICFGNSEEYQNLNNLSNYTLAFYLLRYDNLTIKFGNVKVNVTIKGDITSLVQFEWYGWIPIDLVTKSSYDATAMMKIQAKNSFSRLEIKGGDTSYEKLMDLKNEAHKELLNGKIKDLAYILMKFKQFQARACLGKICSNIKQCTENLCNKQSELTFPKFKMDKYNPPIEL